MDLMWSPLNMYGGLLSYKLSTSCLHLCAVSCRPVIKAAALILSSRLSVNILFDCQKLDLIVFCLFIWLTRSLSSVIISLSFVMLISISVLIRWQPWHDWASTTAEKLMLCGCLFGGLASDSSNTSCDSLGLLIVCE